MNDTPTMNKIAEITGKFVNNILMRSFQAGYDWTSRQHKQELKELEQEILDSLWTTIVAGDDSALPEYGDYLVEVADSEGNKHYLVAEYLPNINYWQGTQDDDRILRWRKIS